MSKKLDANETWKIAWTYIRTVIDTLREPFLILDKDLRIISANKTFYSIFQANKEDTEGELVYDLGNGQWDIPKLKTLLEEILPKDSHFNDFKVEHKFPKIGFKIMLLNARRIYTPDSKKPIIMLAMEDVTRQKQLEDKLKEHNKKLKTEVKKRTKELQKRIDELERLNKLMVGRELKMAELKDEVKKLKKKE